MLKNKILIKTVSVSVMCSLAIALNPTRAEAARLVPLSFAQMYSLARNGNVEALRASVRRGMNIDVMTPEGDTGLCIAARRRDSYTYNAFRAAGANPRHPCTQRIAGYYDFVNSANTAPITATSRTAYGMMGKEEYSVAPWVWWVGGAALLGVGIALAFSGGGGGGDDSSPTPTPTPVTNLDSAGRYLADKGVVRYLASAGENKTNSSDISLTNSQTSIISAMNYNQNVVQNGAYLNVILKSLNGGKYTNNADSILTANSGVVAMSAYKGSDIINNGIIKVSGSNAAVGMLAGYNSTATNSSNSNGIDLIFSGTKKTDTIIGMYGDVGSIITNNGLINGTTSSTSGSTTASTGSMIGMETMIVNANTDSKNTKTEAANRGTINLAAGQGATSASDSVEVSIVGMGTFLDDGFLHGSKYISRAEKAELYNFADITLSYNGKYSSADDYLRQGTGGIVGMKADANGSASNNGNITINMSTTDTSSSNTYAVAAGMQSVHGGIINNNSGGAITITVNAEDNRIAYGMVAVEGSGDVQGLYTIAPTVTNSGTIKMEISNGYGMASYTGGTLQNNGTIVLGKNNDDRYNNDIGMYGYSSKYTDLINKENILIYSHNSVGMQNDFAGGTTLTNDGTITIAFSATESHPFAGAYSNIINNNLIDYQTTPKTNPSDSSSSSTSDFPKDFSFNLKDAVISTDGQNDISTSSSDTSTTKKVTNNGTVKLTGSSYTAAIVNNSALGQVINNGTIELNDKGDGSTRQSVGIYVTSATVNGATTENKNIIRIKTKNSAGMLSNSVADGSSIINAKDGKIYVTGAESIGMFTSATSTSDIYNYGIIDVGNNKSYAIISNGSGKIYNYGSISLSAEGAVAFYIGDKSDIIEHGTISAEANNTIGYSVGGTNTVSQIPDVTFSDAQAEATFTYYDVFGNLTINISGENTIGSGTFAIAENGGKIINNSNFKTGVDGSVLFKGLAGSEITNGGNLTIQNPNSYGIDTAGSAINNSAINVTSVDSVAMRASGNNSTITNGGNITAGASGSSAMSAEGYGASATNNSNIYATGSATTGKSGAYGMKATNSASSTNSGTITISGNGASGMYAESNGTVNNENKINVNNNNASGMYADNISSAGNATNNAVIDVNSANAYGMYANGDDTQATNNNNINVKNSNSYGMYANKGNVTNDANGQISVSGANSSGVYVTNGGSGTNESEATITANNSANGMYAQNGEVANSGVINASGSSSRGMRADANGTVSNESTGSINVSGYNAYGLYNNSGTVSNSGAISVTGANASGIHSDAGNIDNLLDGRITVNNSSAKGMSANSDTASNIGTISVEAGYGMYSGGGALSNTGDVTITGAGAYGMYSENGNITNEKRINVESSATTDVSAGYGIYISGASHYAENKNGQIIVSGDGSSSGGTLLRAGPVGIYATANSVAQNSGSIRVSGFNANGMYANNGATISNGKTNTIVTESNESYAMSAVGSTTESINEGIITVNGNNSIGMYTYGGAKATNASNSEIDVESGDDAKAMYASNGSEIINEGTIMLDAVDSYGMIAVDGTTSNASSAINNKNIIAFAEKSVGMSASGSNTSLTNTDEITASGVNSYGMYVDGSSAKQATGTNSGNILASGQDSVGMYVGGTNANITNKSTITVSGSNAYGMYANGSGATATNASGATITVSASASNSFAMYAENGGTIVNNGTIIVNNLSSYGMYATGSGSSATNTNNTSTHIYVLNEEAKASGLVAEDGATKSGKDPEIKPATLTMSAAAPLSASLQAVSGGKIINNGLISTNSALDFSNSTDTNSSVSIGNGGTFEATSFSGNVVADSNITLGGFENEYTNTDSFVGEDKGLNITSGSYLFNADKALNNNGNTDVVMTMKDFSEVVDNSSLSDFLSENYAEKNNESLFNSLKSAQNSAQFDRNINDLFGQDMLESLTFEDLNILRELNFDMNNNLFEQKKGSFSLSDGISTINGEKFGSSSQYALSGYNDGNTTVAVGLAVSDVRVNGNTKRNNKMDKNIMLSMPIGHKIGGFELVTSPKLGLAHGNYEREGLNGMSYDGNIERKMFALMNEARYPLNLEGIKVVPSAEFNLMGYNIKAREDKKQYSLEINSQNHYSVESGLGLNLEKVFTPSKNSKLKFNGGVAIYKEFADPYDLKVGMNEMNGTYKLKDEKHGDKRTLVRFGAEYNVKENLDISAMIRTNIDRKYRTDAGIGLKYNF